MASGRVRAALAWGVALSLLTVAPGAVASAQPTARVRAIPAASTASVEASRVTAAKVGGYVSAEVRVLPSGKVRIKIRSNAPKVKVKYRTARNRARTKVVRVSTRTHRATVTLPRGSSRITARTLATKRLAPSPVVLVTPGPASGTTGSRRPMAGCAVDAPTADDSQITLWYGCPTVRYTDDPVLGVRMYAYLDPGFTQLAPAAVNPIQLTEMVGTVTFAGLANNATYYFRSTAFDRIGEGEQLAVGGVESGVYLYRHHRAPSIVDVDFATDGTVALTWAHDATDPEPITAVHIHFYAGMTGCDSFDCTAARTVTLSPQSGPDWATRYVGSGFGPGTWCFRVWPADANGLGHGSETKCLIIR